MDTLITTIKVYGHPPLAIQEPTKLRTFTKLGAFRANKEEGFTLIELLIVILIIGILAAIAIPAFMNQRKEAADASSEQM